MGDVGRRRAPYAERVLVGRSREIARLMDLVAAARAGRGGTLVVRGEPGIGKTRLLEHALEHTADATLLEARGVESDAELPYAGLFDLLRPLSDEDLSRVAEAPVDDSRDLLGRLRAGRPVSVDRFAVCTMILRIFCAAAERRPVVVCVDDIHWLDPVSADAIAFAARRIRHDRVAVLLAVRDEVDSPALRGFEEIQLRGLDGVAAAQLLRSLVPSSVTEASAGRLTAATAGNPLALTELAREIGDDLDVWGQLGVAARRSAVELFRDRLGGLDDGARRALLVLALDAGDRSGLVWTAAEHLGVDLAAFERLELASLVVIRDGRVRLAHPLIRSAVLGESPPSTVRAAHRAWVAALDTSGDARQARAWHLAAAAVGPDRAAADALDEVGTEAAKISAHGTAAGALERAAQLTEKDRVRGDRLLRAGVSARLAGRPAQAARLLDEAAGCVHDPTLGAAVDAERGRRHLYHGQVTEAHRLIAASATALQETDPDRAVEMLGVAAWAAMIAADHRRSIALTQRALGLAADREAAPSPIVELTRGTSLLGVGEIVQSYEVLLAAADDVERHLEAVDPEYACFAGVALAWIGEFGRARSLLARVVARERPNSAFGVLSSALHASAYVDARTGRLVSAYAAASEALSTAQASGNDLWRYFSLGCLAYIAGAQGREEDCRRLAGEALAAARTMDIDHSAPVREALGLLELALNRPDVALTHLEPLNRRGGTGELTLGRPTGTDTVEAYLRADRVLPPAVVEQLVTFSENDRFPSLAAQCWRCRGLMADDDDLDACFEAAVALHERTDNPFALARTWLCHGERLRRAGRRSDARARLSAALDLFERLSAGQWASRAEAELRAAGAGPRPEQRPSGVDTLTAQELQVALAVVRDLSNRQVAAELYLSPKTVEFHLGNVYRKLGIRSRTGLVARLTDPQPAITRS